MQTIYGVLDSTGSHVDVSNTLRGAKCYARRNGYTEVSARFNAGYIAAVKSVLFNGRWIDQRDINDAVIVYDNGGQTFDRYTVIYIRDRERNGLYGALAMSDAPFHPQGFGQHTSAAPGKHLGKKITLADLPPDCHKAVLNDIA